MVAIKYKGVIITSLSCIKYVIWAVTYLVFIYENLKKYLNAHITIYMKILIMSLEYDERICLELLLLLFLHTYIIFEVSNRTVN